MVKLIDKQNIFNAGIVSPKLFSRDDLKQYNNGIQDAQNFICSRYGPIEKRVGTNMIWDLGNPGYIVNFIPFVYNIEQSLMLEFMAHTIRFYTFDGAQFGPIADTGIWRGDVEGTVTDIFTKPDDVLQAGTKTYTERNRVNEAGNIQSVVQEEDEVVAIVVDDIQYNRVVEQYRIDTPFTNEQVKGLSYVQSLDVIYMAFADGKTQPYTLRRYANNNWQLVPFEAEDGPYLDQNYDPGLKMQITDVSTDTSLVNFTGFTLGAQDVGRWVRINTPRYNENTFAYEDRWSYGKITVMGAGGTNCRVKWSYRFSSSEAGAATWMQAATSEWRLGVWHPETGNTKYPVTYPTKVSIHQQRLTWGGMTTKPWIWTSNSFAYNNYAPSNYEGEISDSNSIYADISTDKVSEIFWIKSVKSLLIGTELGEIRMYSAGTAVTPSDYVTNRESSYGSYNGEPIVTDDMLIFIQRLQRTIRSLSYDYNADAYIGPELTIIAEHLTAGGVKKIVYQKEPNNTVWCLKEDGELLTLTYDKSQEVIGWSRSKLAGEGTKVIDIAVLPSKVYQQDMVLMAVERTVDGQRKRYMELLSRNFTEDVDREDISFLDCAMRFQSEEPFNQIVGLDYLKGQKVRVIERGSLLGDYEVHEITSGEGEEQATEIGIELDTETTDALVGLPYDAYFETLERDFGDKQISTKVSKLRVYYLGLYVVRTLGLTVQRLSNGVVAPLITFNPTAKTDVAPELITGKIEVKIGSSWDNEYRLKFISEPGLPCMIAGITQGVEINAL